MLILDNKFENVKSAKFVLNILTSDLKKNRQNHKISLNYMLFQKNLLFMLGLIANMSMASCPS